MTGKGTNFPVSLNFRITPEMADYLDFMSLNPEFQGRRSEVVRKILQDYIDNNPL